MLIREEAPILSEYLPLYDIVVPKDHILRKLKELCDFEFVFDELKNKYCEWNGRVAEHPVRMFKYLMLKDLYDMSDRDLVSRAHSDMSFKYFLDLAPEAEVIHPTTLTKFRKQRLKDMELLDLLIKKSVSVAFENGVIKSKTIIIDATHTRSYYNSKTPIEALRERSKNLRRRIYKVNEKMKDKMPEKYTGEELEQEIEYTKQLLSTIEDSGLSELPGLRETFHSLQEAVEDNKEQLLSNIDQEARIGHKSADTSFFGYKNHLAINDERIITAAVVTPGNEGDGKYLETLTEKSKEAGMEVEEILADGAYSGRENLEYAKKNNIKLVSKLNPSLTNDNHKEKFDYNKDADQYICPAGHHSIRKARTGKKNQKNRNQSKTYYFDIEKCQNCPLREGCYKSGAKFKTYSVTIKAEIHNEQKEFQETEEFKESARNRYKIEAKNDELKNRHGLKTCKSDGLFGMTLQSAITIFVVNLKRIMTLMEEKKEKIVIK